MSLNFQATRFRCSWPWETAVLLCDGRVVCGCADPYGKRVLGDARDTHGRRDLDRRDRVDACAAISTPADPRSAATARSSCRWPTTSRRAVRPLDVGPAASRRCPAASTSRPRRPATSRASTRAARPRPASPGRARPACSTSALFERVLDELGPTLARIDFFNYGEAFLHKKAVEMCELVKTRYPHIYLYTSTNGGAFTEDARAAAGAVGHRRDDVLARRRLAGRLRALPAARQLREVHAMMRAAIDEKRAPRARRAGHQLALHPVQLERQRPRDGAGPASAPPSGASIACAGRSPITPSTPTRAGSRRAPRSTPRSATRSGTTTTSATPSPARCRGRGSRCAAQRARRAARRRARRDDPRRPRASATCRSGPSPPPRPTAAATSASARSSRHADGALDRPRLGARLPAAPVTERRPAADVAIEVPAPREPGRYALRFDLVSEGIDWFETCGSEPTVRELVVAHRS